MDVATLSLIAFGLAVGLVTYKSGLRQFGIGLAVIHTAGEVLAAQGYRTIGGVLVMVSLGLVFWSGWLMRKHHIGPFSPKISS